MQDVWTAERAFGLAGWLTRNSSMYTTHSLFFQVLFTAEMINQCVNGWMMTRDIRLKRVVLTLN